MLLRGKDSPVDNSVESLKLVKSAEARQGTKLTEVEVSSELRNSLVTAEDETAGLRLALESGDPDKNIDEADTMIATFYGPKNDIMALVELLLGILNDWGGGVTDVKAYRADDTDAAGA